MADRDGEAVTQLPGMVAGAEALEAQPNGIFVVGSDGVDIAAIKPHLQAATPLLISTPEERQAALAKVPRWRRRTRRCSRRRRPRWVTHAIPAPAKFIRPTCPFRTTPRPATSASKTMPPEPTRPSLTPPSPTTRPDSFTVAGGDAADAYPDYQQEPATSSKPGPGPGLPGPGLPGPRIPVPGPAVPHLPVPHLPGIPSL